MASLRIHEDRISISRKRAGLLAGVCAVMFAALPGAAYAQDAADATKPADQTVYDGDIMVTAQRDASLASKTPIAITAIGGDALLSQGVTNPVQLANEVPGLEINRYFGLQISIRGVTNSDTTAKGDPSAAFLLNGVYIARPQAQETSFFDVDRVEVLRGPQGTLFGRNSTAGVIDVITKRPTDQFEVEGNVGYGNYDNIQADAAINLPLGSTAAIRVAGSLDRRDTYFVDEPGEQYSANPYKDNKSVRASLKWDPTDNISLLVIGDYASLKGIPQLFIDGTSFYAPVDGDTSNRAFVEGASTKERLRRGYLMTLDPYANDENYGIHGELSWNLGPVTATYVGSYRRFTMDEGYTDLLGAVSPTFTTQSYNQDSHELRFSLNDNDKLKLQVGGSYFHESSFQYFDQPDYFGLDHFILDYGPTKATSYAAFGQATYSLTDSLRATAGIRYTEDKKSQQGFVVFKLAPFPDTVSISGSSRSFDKITWRLGLDYDLNPDNLLYAAVSTGYKAGGFNDGCIAGTSPGGNLCNNPIPEQFLFYNPETLTSYEAGLKGRTANNVFRYTLTGYYYDYKNLQLNNTADIGLGVPTLLIQNAGSARVYGLEFEGTVKPDDRSTISFFGSLMSGKYTEYMNGNLDFSGKDLDRSPTGAVTVSYTYSLPLASGATIDLNARSKFSGAYYIGSTSTVQTLRQRAFTRSEASLTYNAPDSVWYLQAYVRNIENKVQITAATNLAGVLAIAPSDPRTYGVRAGFKF